MIAIDTNIIVRLLTKDDPAQYKKSYALFQNEILWIPDTVILETEWVLRYAYEFTPAQICAAFRKLLGLQNVHVDHPQLLAKVILWHESGLDFADAFHLVKSHSCQSLKTFDQGFIKKSLGLSECAVEKL